MISTHSMGQINQSSLTGYNPLLALCGSYNVGVGQTYTTLTAAINDLNANGISCPVTFILTDNAYPSETFPITIGIIGGTSYTSTVTIKPGPGKTPVFTGSSASAILIINGSKYIIIDGSNSGGSDKSLTWENTSTTTNTYSIEFMNNGGTPAKNVIVKNCLVRASSQLTKNTFGIFMDNSPGGFDSITISNNTIYSARIGIQYQGAAGNPATNGKIINNIIGSTTDAQAIQFRGIFLRQADNTLVQGNEIMGAPLGNTNTAQAGIWIPGGAQNTIIRQNSIHDWYYNGTGGFGNYGIYYGAAAVSPTEISNNVITTIKADGNNSNQDNVVAGIYINSGGNILIYHNSIWLTGAILRPANIGVSACLSIFSGITNLDIRDNIFKNSQTLASGTTGRTYAVYCASANTAFTSIDNNDYFVNGVNPFIGFLGSNRATLAAWKTATGQDVNSLNIDPLFTGVNDLHTTVAGLAKTGVFLPLVPYDLTGAGRTDPPDIGAYQFSSNPVVTSNNATGITTTTATLNGSITANNASVVSGYDYGLTTAYGSSVAGVPLTITGNTATGFTGAISGLSTSTLYHFRAKGTSGSVTVNGSDFTFTTAGGTPIAQTMAATAVTTTSATLNGVVNANGDITTVNFDYGLTATYGTTIPGIPNTVAGNTLTPVSVTITGLTINMTYHFRVCGTNANGSSCGNDMTFSTGCQAVGPAGLITGPISVCQGGSGYVYSVTPITNATDYVWTLPSGGTITSGNNTNTITVSYSSGALSGNVSVYGTSICGNGATSQIAVTVNALTVPVVTGSNDFCVNSGFYTYTTQSGMNNYVWTISPGGLITWGQGTNTVQVVWNLSGTQSLNVVFTNANGCAPSAPTLFPVTVNPLPGSAGSITGVAAVCGGASGITYSVQPVNDAVTYVWTLPSGATISTGAGTNAITVDFVNNASSGVITVYGNNLCGNGALSPPFSVSMSPLPDPAGVITGSDSVCQGISGVVYSVSTIPNATGYFWSIPSGSIIVSGINTSSITVDFGMAATSGNINVYGTNACGNGNLSPDFPVTVSSVPPAPVITLIPSDTLMSNIPDGNQWYLEGSPIPGATNQIYIPTIMGNYWDVVKLNGCSSDTSNHILFWWEGINPHSKSSVIVYPVPNNGSFNISLATFAKDSVDIMVFNSLGVKIYENMSDRLQREEIIHIDIRSVPSGIYTVIIRNSKEQLFRKILVIN